MLKLLQEIADRTAQQTTVLDRIVDRLLDQIEPRTAPPKPDGFACSDWDGLN